MRAVRWMLPLLVGLAGPGCADDEGPGCGNITEQGSCEGNVVEFCLDNTVTRVDYSEINCATCSDTDDEFGEAICVECLPTEE